MKKLSYLAIFFWLTVIGIAFFWNYSTVIQSHRELAFQTSRAFFNQIVLDRAWNARHGGVYVPITEQTKPNPYLEDPLRDLETNKGISLTKVNPAFMTRQIAEIAALESGLQFHITSLKPIRPENKPTDWEKTWLQAFENGSREEGKFVHENPKIIFHYMAPLITKQDCLKCHAKHGYKVGDIRGGISVTLPFFPKPHVAPLFFGYGFAAIIGCGFILFSVFLLEKSRKKLVLANESLESEIKARKVEDLQWSTAMDVYDDALYLLDMNRHIIRANKTFYLMTGSRPETAIGRHITEIVHPHGGSDPCPACQAQEEICDSVIIMERDHPDNPAGRPIEKIVKIIRDEQDQPISIFTNLHDLTNSRKEIEEKRKLEEELFRAHKFEAIGTLAGGIAHDFNNILAAILGYSDMVLEELPEGSQAWEDQQAVLEAGNRAKELVKQILAFSRKSQETQQPMQPYLVIKEALKLMHATMPSTIEIQEEIDSASGSILANPTNVHQILVNLCTNALHAMEDEQGVITVTLRQVELNEADTINEPGGTAGTFVELMVSDTGCGMDNRTMERIFEPYYTTKEVGKGSGMGLAMVHGIIQSYGGFIKVNSTPGKGSTFRIYFPALIGMKTVEIEEKQRKPLPKGNERVLVVDDEETIVGMYRTTLNTLGYKVTAHCSSEKTLEVFLTSPDSFDLIITDQTMPKLTGSELAKEILKIRPGIPIILCTGYSSMITEEKAKEIGIEKFLMKPFERKTLAKTVREVLDKYKTKAI